MASPPSSSFCLSPLLDSFFFFALYESQNGSKFKLLGGAKEYAESQDGPQLKALDEQNKYAVSQGLYPNDWWSIGEEVICAQLKTPNVPESQLKELLNKYQSRIEMLVEK